MKSILVNFTRKTVELPDGVTLGQWQASLIKADGTAALDAAGAPVAPQTGDGSAPFTFGNLLTGDYVGVVQRLDSAGAPFGDAVKSDAVHLEVPTGEVPQSVVITVA